MEKRRHDEEGDGRGGAKIATGKNEKEQPVANASTKRKKARRSGIRGPVGGRHFTPPPTKKEQIYIPSPKKRNLECLKKPFERGKQGPPGESVNRSPDLLGKKERKCSVLGW